MTTFRTAVLVAGVALCIGPVLGEDVVEAQSDAALVSATLPGRSNAEPSGPWGMWWGILDSRPTILDLRPGRFSMHVASDSVTEPGDRLFAGSLARQQDRWRMSPVPLEGDAPARDFHIAEHDERDLILSRTTAIP